VGWLDAGNTGAPSGNFHGGVEEECRCQLDAF
jgi:hypothetical protein